jgi:hypothetical protein
MWVVDLSAASEHVVPYREFTEDRHPDLSDWTDPAQQLLLVAFGECV